MYDLVCCDELEIPEIDLFKVVVKCWLLIKGVSQFKVYQTQDNSLPLKLQNRNRVSQENDRKAPGGNPKNFNGFFKTKSDFSAN